MKLKLLFVITLTQLFCGCATIFDGSRQQILVNTYPAQSTVSRNGVELGLTPTIVNIRRKETSPLVLTSEGYERKEIHLTRKFNSTTYYNFINIYGWLLDAITGSNHRFKETSVVQSLVRNKEEKVISRMDHLDQIVSTDTSFYWSTKAILEYTDFRGALPNEYKLFGAATYSDIFCSYSLSDSTAVVRVLTCFMKNKSFFNAKKADMKYVLSHEQQHYNITEIMSRKIRQQVAAKTFSKAGFEKELNRLVFTIEQDWQAYQAEYDQYVYNISNIFETGRQKEWNKKVEKQLNDLKDFEATDVPVRFLN